MIFQHTADWIFGVSPHTGEPKTETSRLVKGAEEWLPYLNGSAYANMDAFGKYVGGHYVNQVAAVQPGRGMKGIGYIHILKLGRGDARAITPQQARAEGFATPLDFLLLWTQMHDKPAYSRYAVDLNGRDYADVRNWATDHGKEWLTIINARELNRYDRWIIRFEAVQP